MKMRCFAVKMREVISAYQKCVAKSSNASAASSRSTWAMGSLLRVPSGSLLLRSAGPDQVAADIDNTLALLQLRSLQRYLQDRIQDDVLILLAFDPTAAPALFQ